MKSNCSKFFEKKKIIGGNHQYSLTYSSMLNVFTYLNEILPSLWNLISCLYIPSGVLPVGSPSTKYLQLNKEHTISNFSLIKFTFAEFYLSALGLKSLIRFKTYRAAHSPTSPLASNITKRIFHWFLQLITLLTRLYAARDSQFTTVPVELLRNVFARTTAVIIMSFEFLLLFAECTFFGSDRIE